MIRDANAASIECTYACRYFAKAAVNDSSTVYERMGIESLQRAAEAMGFALTPLPITSAPGFDGRAKNDPDYVENYR